MINTNYGTEGVNDLRIVRVNGGSVHLQFNSDTFQNSNYEIYLKYTKTEDYS